MYDIDCLRLLNVTDLWREKETHGKPYFMNNTLECKILKKRKQTKNMVNRKSTRVSKKNPPIC